MEEKKAIQDVAYYVKLELKAKGVNTRLLDNRASVNAVKAAMKVYEEADLVDNIVSGRIRNLTNALHGMTFSDTKLTKTEKSLSGIKETAAPKKASSSVVPKRDVAPAPKNVKKKAPDTLRKLKSDIAKNVRSLGKGDVLYDSAREYEKERSMWNSDEKNFKIMKKHMGTEAVTRDALDNYKIAKDLSKRAKKFGQANLNSAGLSEAENLLVRAKLSRGTYGEAKVVMGKLKSGKLSLSEAASMAQMELSNAMAGKDNLNNKLLSMNNKELLSAGYVRVPGYTRSDGSKVKTHFRKLK